MERREFDLKKIVELRNKVEKDMQRQRLELSRDREWRMRKNMNRPTRDGK